MRQQLKMDRQEGLADDVQARGRQQIVDVGDAAGDRVLDRDHAEVGRAVLQRRERVLEGRAGQRLVVGKIFGAGDVRIGAGFALIGDGLCRGHDFPLGASRSRARLQIVGRVDAERSDVDERDVDPHARLQRAQLLEPLAPLQRRGRQGDETRERGAAVGVEADMVQQVALAPGRARAGEVERAQPPLADRASRPP